MSNKKLRDKADIKAEVYARETERELEALPDDGGWLEFEAAEKIRPEIEGKPDWKEGM